VTTHAVAASSDAAGIQSDEGGSQPTLLLHTPEDFSRRRFDIRIVNQVTAEKWLARWHYLVHPPGSATHYGLFAPDMGALVSVGQPNNTYGLAAKYGLGDFVGNFEISRVARHPGFAVETSRIVRLVLRRLRDDGVEWVFSYADPRAGHHGGIYQALGAIYVGVSKSQRGVELANGERIHPRSMVALYGSWSRATVEGLGAKFIEDAHGGLHTYILPLARRAEIEKALVPFRQPYPKRAPA